MVVGDAVTLAPVDADRLPDGLQLYVLPPVAVNVVFEPVQIVALALLLIVGSGLTLTVTVAVLIQPLPLVPVTV